MGELGFRLAAKAVIIADGGLLILHPSGIDRNRNWHTPGGIRDDINESIVDTAIREVREETGLDLSPDSAKPFKVSEWRAVDRGEEVKITAIFFVFNLDMRPGVVLSHEHDQFAWISKQNYKDYQLNPEVLEIIEDLF